MRRQFHGPLARLTLFAAITACASAPAQRAYIAPSNDTITSDTDVRSGDPPTHVVTIYNRSSVPVTVWSVSLINCQNVKGACGARRTNIRIPAGGSAMAARIEPDNPRASFSYRFHYAWRPDSAQGAAAISALASVDPAISGSMRELSRADFQRLGGRIARIRPHPESLHMRPGERAQLADVRIHVLDARDSVLGFTRWIGGVSVSGHPAVEFQAGTVLARHPGRGGIHYRLADEAQAALPARVADVELPILVAYRFDADAPAFNGRVLDAESRKALACARVAVEDSAKNVVNRSRTDESGAFSLKAPSAGTYRVRVDMFGWSPSYGPPVHAAANEVKTAELLVQFTDQVMVMRGQAGDGTYERARPASVRFEPGTAPRASARRVATPVIQGVTLTGSETLPILGIQAPLPPQTLWAQFVVDTAGRVDTTSIALPPRTTGNVTAAVRYVMPRLRFTPARDAGVPTCDLVRLQVNVSPR